MYTKFQKLKDTIKSEWPIHYQINGKGELEALALVYTIFCK